jgi:hypothetical protein
MTVTLDDVQVLEEAILARLRAERKARRIMDAEEQRYEPPRLLTVEELFAQPDPDFLIDSLLPEFSLSELVGDSESLKSFLAIHLGLAVATGQKDFFGLQVVKPGAVIYICAEGGGNFKHRVRAWGQEKDIDIRDIPFYTIKSPVNLRNHLFQLELTALVTKHHPVLIIVDTLHRCTPGANENSAQDMGEVVGFSQRLQIDHHAAVMYLHHPPKNAQNGRGRGSGSIYNAADTEIQATVLDEDKDTGVKTVKFEVVKQKDDRKVSLELKSRIVAVYNELGRPLCYSSGRAVTTCVLESMSRDESERKARQRSRTLQDEIVQYVRTFPGCSRQRVKEGVTGKTSVIASAINDLLAQGRLRNSGTADKSKLSVVDVGVGTDNG